MFCSFSSYCAVVGNMHMGLEFGSLAYQNSAFEMNIAPYIESSNFPLYFAKIFFNLAELIGKSGTVWFH